MRYLRLLYVQVLVGILLGGLIGHFWPAFGADLKPLGDAFVNLIKMLIGPIIFTTVVVGLAGMGDLKKAGSVGFRAFLYFEIITTVALVIGLIVANVFTPGAGFHATPASLDAKSVASYATAAQGMSVVDYFLHIIPKTFVGAFADGDVLQVLLLAVLFGLALGRLGDHARPVINLLHEVARVFFGIVAIVTRFAPIAAAGAMAFTIGKFGLSTLFLLGKLMLCVYLTCGLFIFVVLGAIMHVSGFSLWKVLVLLKDELLIVVGTSTSESALPGLMEKMEKVGCARPTVGIVVPAGYSFNLDGTCIYLTMAALFIAQATDTPMTLAQQLGLMGVLLLTSKGAAGVTGSGFITLAATLATTGHIPVAGIALILGVDRFMSEARAITNFIGNAVATLVISKWSGDYDSSKGSEVLRR
ncbi:MAG: C4-dicarboxylate transporter DctA [Verrucomicrobia bacterium]|jgi:aerobic C4-dicarboxylate transport protein|nr:C4-dicarboxylate transporter DctA [Verrucomicrobiota bacterium]